MQDLGVMPIVIERCLNHVSSLDQSKKQPNREAYDLGPEEAPALPEAA